MHSKSPINFENKNVADDCQVIADLIRAQAKQRPNDIALVFEGRETNYAELEHRTNQIANGLIAEGLAIGDRIAFLGKNSDSYFEYWFGAAKAGIVLVPVNWRLAAPEVAYILSDCSPKFIVCDPEFLDSLNKNISCPVITTENHASFREFAHWRDSQPDEDPRRDAHYCEAVLQLYTSGTTGNPKGAILTNRSLLQLRREMPKVKIPDWYRWSPEDVSLIAMPVFHISGSGWALWSIQHGAKGIIVRELDPANVFDLLVTYKITKIILVPTALRIVCEHPDALETDFSFLKYICYGGSAIPLDLLQQAINIFGCGFAQMYGMTETAGTITGLPPEDHDPKGNKRMRGIGIPLPGVEIKIIDRVGNSLPHSEVGEITTRSAANFSGYHNLPDANAETMDSEGWLRTGDAGHMDKNGYIFLADRIKDMIITGGENVYPAEVENALFSHPDVSDVAVIGVPDPKWGEAVKAIVVPVDGCTPNPEDLKKWARSRIAGYKTPKSIEFANELPRNSSGKVLRRLLKDQYR